MAEYGVQLRILDGEDVLYPITKVDLVEGLNNYSTNVSTTKTDSLLDNNNITTVYKSYKSVDDDYIFTPDVIDEQETEQEVNVYLLKTDSYNNKEISYMECSGTGTLYIESKILNYNETNYYYDALVYKTIDEFSKKLGQYLVIPQASSDYEDSIIQYIGETTSQYVQGRIYICKNIYGNNYEWQQIKYSTPVDDTTIEEFEGYLRLKDNGITKAKLNEELQKELFTIEQSDNGKITFTSLK